MAQVTRLNLDSPPAAAANPTVPPGSEAQLRELLKYCAPSTYEAALQFRQTARPEYLPPIVLGVMARYMEPERRKGWLEFRDELRLAEDLGLDSLALMEIVIRLEEVLQVSIRDEDLRRIRTLGEIRRLFDHTLPRSAPAVPPPTRARR